MSKLLIIAAGALAVLAFAALPAGASAEEMEAHCSAAPCVGTVESTGIARLTEDSGLGVTCQKTTGTVTQSAATSKTVSVTLTFEECKDPFGGECMNEGGGGKVETNALTGHLITITKGNPATAGVLLTGVNTEFGCVFVPDKVVTGNILGTITNPECGKAVTHRTIYFAQVNGGNQSHKTYTGSTFDLLSNGTTSSQTGEGHLNYTGGKTVTITC